MSTNLERSPDSNEAFNLLDPGDLDSSPQAELATAKLPMTTDEATRATVIVEVSSVVTLAELPPGARLVLRCRKDWRAASVSSLTPDCVVLIVASPTGHTYRVRRPVDAVLTFDGSIPILSDRDSTGWRVALARYDARW